MGNAQAPRLVRVAKAAQTFEGIVVAAAPADEKAEAPAQDAKEPVVKAPARSSESELDIMVED